MALKNYRVTNEDGTETYYQFDADTDLGKSQVQAFKDAAKDDGSPVKSIAEGDPRPFNAGGK